MFDKSKNNGGFIKIIIIIVVLIFIATYIGLDLRSVVESESFQNNMEAAFTVSESVVNFLRPAFEWLWEKALYPLIDSFINSDNTTSTAETITETETPQ